MSIDLIARIVVTAIAAGQGIVPLFVDLNRTHATNVLWTGHARFHVVSQTFTFTLAAMVEVMLLWMPWPDPQARFYLATTLTAVPIVSFLLAAVVRRIYGGTLHDPNGIPPVRVGRRLIHVNVVIEIVASVLLVAAVLAY